MNELPSDSIPSNSASPARSAADRPRKVGVVLGTATEVGKTWATARIVEALRRSRSEKESESGRGRLVVSVRKPLQSFDPASKEPTDSQVLAAASGEPPEVICATSCSFPVPMAPPMAASVLGVEVPTISELVAGLNWPLGVDLGLVETVGGVRSPLGSDGDSRDLANALAPDVVILVADAGLGVINSVRSAVDALAPLSPIVFLNYFDSEDDLHRRNLEWLALSDGLSVFTSVDELVGFLECEVLGQERE